MSIEKPHDSNPADDLDRLGYELFRKGSVRRFNPTLFAVKREDSRGWFLVELKQGKWACDCQVDGAVDASATCAHVYAALLSSASHRTDADLAEEVVEEMERPLKCRYCGSPDISRVGFRYNARGISRRYFCNECRRKFSVPYVEPHAAQGLPSGTLWLLSQVAMLTSKLNDLLKDLDERISSTRNSEPGREAGDGAETPIL
jgi:transposase-like protein